MIDEATLGRYLSTQSGRSVAVIDIRRITVGHSRAMYRVITETGAKYVIRMEQGGVFGTSGSEEFRVMQHLHSIGFPVAKVRWYEPTGSVLGHPFFVMDYLDEAEDADDRVLDGRTCADFVRRLNQLHSFDVSRGEFGFDVVPESPTTKSPSSATHAQIDRWADVYRSASEEPIPLLEEAAAWLHMNAPPLQRLSIVHGDAGPGNFVQSNGRVVAITDWEFAHLGDPAEDWSFCLTMRGVRTLARDTWIELFRSVAGVEMTDAQWHYWEAFNMFKGACANHTCLGLFERGANRAPNMAIIATLLHQVFLRRLADVVSAP